MHAPRTAKGCRLCRRATQPRGLILPAMGFNLIPTKARSTTQKNGSGSKRRTQAQGKKRHSTPKLPMTLSCLSTRELDEKTYKKAAASCENHDLQVLETGSCSIDSGTNVTIHEFENRAPSREMKKKITKHNHLIHAILAG
ncbi:uncharacterized protein BO87DRAFT_163316 [Aspergillus neoniger CBS 115656]|uniref:Uncharacterized protein n=1 Tax=Aspergillus neoniger (strain CBS 115656) TaxID=1448310 RepID=A0A318YUT2_ASPNB|nr:hypothetical protein BO87DRAFT_163316 [Aspergillus neoniger CBS 115656]PYH38196.1 hypothetical protein BO87DRAFT_163316 [Aspergillus neoniger CBS 115656]